MRLDSHQHFWNYSQADYPWIPQGTPLLSDWLPTDLAPLLDREGLEGCIAVQARQSLAESHWLIELANRQPIIKGVVGWVDLQAEDVDKDLSELARHQKFVGVRHVVQDEPDDKFMLRPNFLRGIGMLKAHKFTYDILIFPKQLPAAIELVRQFPEQPFVLDHIAKPHIKDGSISPWREQISELAKYPNVMCKVSGMVTEANHKGWKYEDFVPYLDVVTEAFGTDRLMYGSDWPVCLLAAPYEEVFGIARRYFENFSNADKDRIFGGNAERFYLQGRSGM